MKRAPMRKFVGLCLTVALSPVSSHGIIFSDQTVSIGVGDSGFGNGSSFADYDNDGWPDLLVARFGRTQEALLYRNLGDGRFSLRPDALEKSTDALSGVFVDLQADGDLDIFLLKHNSLNLFYLNEGGTYRLIAVPPGLTDSPWATSALFGDFDVDGGVDLFITHRTNQRNRLYSAILTDHAADVTDVTSTLQGGEDSWGATAFDYDGDGNRDLYVSNFGATNRLYRNLGDGAFQHSTEAAGLDRPSRSLTAVAADFDNDSDLDLYVLNSAPEPNTLYENRNGGEFIDISEGMGVGQVSGQGGAWGDFDNDGDLDLIVADGRDVTVWRNDTDGFTDISASAYPPASSARPVGPAIADYDRDGDVDIFLASNNAPDLLLRNDTPAAGHWLEVELRSSDDGHSPLGTVLRARMEGDRELTRDYVVGTSIGIVHGDLLHLGTGMAESIPELVVEWPSGMIQVLRDVVTDRVIALEEPQPQRDLAISSILEPRLDSSWGTGVQSEVEITNRGSTPVEDALLRVTITFSGRVVHESSLPVPVLGPGETALVGEDAWHSPFSGEHVVEFELEPGDDVIANDNRERRVYMHQFEEVAAQVGVDESQPGFAGAFADYDNDGDLDLYVSNGGWEEFADNVLYRNDGEAGFTDVTEAAGVTEDGNGTAVLFADFDRDGYLDLFAARGGFVSGGEQNLLFHNERDGTFTDVSLASGLDDEQRSFGVTAGDYDDDGYLDLFVSQIRGHDNILYRNTGDGRFVNVAEERRVLSLPDGGGSAAAFADYDNDGDLDLYATNFGDFDQLHTEVGETAYSTLLMGDQGGAVSMSLGDIEEDGDLDLYIVKNDGLSALWRNDLSQGVFTNVAASSGVENLASGHGGTFGDFDNDGDLDIFVANNTAANRVYVNQGDGTFIDWAAALGMATVGNALSIVLGDYDADGDLDAYVIEEDAPNRLFRNGGSQHTWLDVQLRGVVSNTDGIGARVTTHSGDSRQMWAVNAAGAFSANSPGARFGLGDIARLDSLVVAWPSGAVDTYENVTTNARMKVVEGAGVTAIEEENGSLPLSFALEQNFPNPFNAATSIHFTIPAEAPVRLDIFNSVGQLVRVLVEERLGAGRYKARWHGRSDDGGAAASGVYFASLTAGQDVARRSIMLVK